MIEYVIEVEVPAGPGVTRWMQLGPSTTDLTGIAPVYSALAARGDRVQLVEYGPRVIRSYKDKAVKAVAPSAPAVDPESLIKTRPDGRVVLPTAQEILDRVNAQGINPVDDDAIAAVVAPQPPTERARELYEAAGLIPHTNVLGEVTGIPAQEPSAEQTTPDLKLTTADAAQLDAALEDDGKVLPGLKALMERPAPWDTTPELEPLPAEGEEPEIPEPAPLMPGDPGFLEAFRAQQAGTTVVHRHADGARTTRVSQANS